MFLHRILAIAGLATSAGVGAIPTPTNTDLPPPNPWPEVIGSIPDFTIAKFEAQAIVLSDRTYVNFYISPYPGSAFAHCFGTGTTSDHKLSSIPQTWCKSANGTEMNDENLWTTTNDIWFSWTVGEDVDPKGAPGTDPIDSMYYKNGAYLRIVRQGHGEKQSRDESIHHVLPYEFETVGEEMLEHQVYTGDQNFSTKALRVEAKD
ncbi:uncharacterized protein B0T15DRAFT_46739 [Chaetomium strumarium]|uniref:Uncharacterized protein n=1 Tax=Chaetomium strumarium TaxID=1170767 RepID=A0AAJ0M6H6_9PEZI|nr:hypothetical protein B0T15DRAFT_46739 [Chaetomium strumarium]